MAVQDMDLTEESGLSILPLINLQGSAPEEEPLPRGEGTHGRGSAPANTSTTSGARSSAPKGGLGILLSSSETLLRSEPLLPVLPAVPEAAEEGRQVWPMHLMASSSGELPTEEQEAQARSSRHRRQLRSSSFPGDDVASNESSPRCRISIAQPPPPPLLGIKGRSLTEALQEHDEFQTLVAEGPAAHHEPFACRPDPDSAASWGGRSRSRVGGWKSRLVRQGSGGGSGGGDSWRPLRGLERYALDMSQLALGEHFAAGGQGHLYRGVYGGRNVAVKFVKWGPGSAGKDAAADAKRQERSFRQEATILSLVQHPHVLEFLGASKRGSVGCLVTEYMDGRDLQTHIRRHPPPPLEERIRMALCVTRGLHYLHTQNLLHRDLKSSNLLIGEGRKVKVADFGVAREEAAPSLMTSSMGTMKWMAPEMIENGPYTRSIDVYSFGIVLWELVAWQQPYPDMSFTQAAFAVARKGLRPSIPDGCPTALSHLMQQCWHADPLQRPPFSQILPALERILRLLTDDPASAALRAPALASPALSIPQRAAPLWASSSGSGRGGASSGGGIAMSATPPDGASTSSDGGGSTSSLLRRLLLRN